jgi:hypothetical protein
MMENAMATLAVIGSVWLSRSCAKAAMPIRAITARMVEYLMVNVAPKTQPLVRAHPVRICQRMVMLALEVGRSRLE